MSNLSELYQDLILDHSQSPRHFGKLDPADYVQEGFNPLCGDKVMIYLREKDGKIEAAKFEGCGCAISMASASLMTEALLGKTKTEITELFKAFHDLVTQGMASCALGKLMAFSGVFEYPMRVKCATLAWHSALAALNQKETV